MHCFCNEVLRDKTYFPRWIFLSLWYFPRFCAQDFGTFEGNAWCMSSSTWIGVWGGTWTKQWKDIENPWGTDQKDVKVEADENLLNSGEENRPLDDRAAVTNPLLKDAILLKYGESNEEENQFSCSKCDKIFNWKQWLKEAQKKPHRR